MSRLGAHSGTHSVPITYFIHICRYTRYYYLHHHRHRFRLHISFESYLNVVTASTPDIALLLLTGVRYKQLVFVVVRKLEKTRPFRILAQEIK